MRRGRGECDLVTLHIFLLTRVCAVAPHNASHELIYPLAVTDTCVLLSLIAGLKTGTGVTLVKEGKVCRVASAQPLVLTADDLGTSRPTSLSARTSFLGLS